MSEQAQSKKMADYLKVVWKRKWVLLALLVLSVGGSILYYHQQEPLYRTSMKVQLSNASSLGQEPGGEVGLLLKSLVDTDSVKMTRLAVLKDPSTVRLMVENKIVKAEKRPEYFRGRTKDDIYDEMLSSISVNNTRGTQLIEIEATGPKPDLLPWIARQFWEQFTDMHKSMQGAIMSDGLLRVSGERDTAQREFKAKDKEMAGHLATSGYTRTSLESTRQWYSSEHSRLNKALASLGAEIALERGVAEKVAEALDGEGDAGLTAFDDQDFLRSSEPFNEAKEALTRLRREHKYLREDEGLGPNHGKVQAAEQAIAVLEARIAKIRGTLCDLFVSGYEGKVALEGTLRKQFNDLRLEIETFEKVDSRFEELSGELEMRKSQFELLDRAHEKLRNERDKSAAVGGIIIEPDLPRAPFSPDLLLILGAGIMIGLILGAGLTLGLEAIDDSIRAEDEVEQALKLPCLGVIHTPDSRRGGTPAVDLASIVDPRSIFAEEFRSIRTSLGFTFDRRRERHYSMLVTSFEVQEGKTTVSTNLATVIAASGLRTLLVDADMRNGRIHRTFGLTSERGLSDVLAGESKLEDVIEDTEIANLAILPAGSLYDNPAEMLESPEMRQLLEALSERYDRVVFDTPPSGPVTDAMVLGKQVDAVILIAAAGKSRKRLLRRTVKNMLAIGIRIAGVVLNEMKPGRKRYYRKYLHLYRRGA